MSAVDSARQRAAAVLSGYQHKAPSADLAGRALLGADLADALQYLLAALGQAIPEGAYTLTDAETVIVLDALDVAARYRREAAANCADCNASPTDLCDPCDYQLQFADQQDRLGEKIRGQS